MESDFDRLYESWEETAKLIGDDDVRHMVGLGVAYIIRAALAASGREVAHADHVADTPMVIESASGYGRRVVLREYECDLCGGTYEHVSGDYEYCPRRGARLVDGKDGR